MSILTHAFNLFLLFLHVILLQHSVRVVCRIAMSLRVVFLTTLMPPESYHIMSNPILTLFLLHFITFVII
jgi:hypothetical protein